MEENRTGDVPLSTKTHGLELAGGVMRLLEEAVEKKKQILSRWLGEDEDSNLMDQIWFRLD